MKRKLLTTLLMLSIILISASAEARELVVGIKGMVCNFCAQSIEGKFKKEKAVKSVDVNLDDRIMILKFKKDQTLTDDQIKGLVKDAGYLVEYIKEK